MTSSVMVAKPTVVATRCVARSRRCPDQARARLALPARPAGRCVDCASQCARSWRTRRRSSATRSSVGVNGSLIAWPSASTAACRRPRTEATTTRPVGAVWPSRCESRAGGAVRARRVVVNRTDTPGSGGRIGPNPRRRAQGDGPGHLATPEALRERQLPLGVLRRIEEPVQALVFDGHVRKSREGRGVPPPPHDPNRRGRYLADVTDCGGASPRFTSARVRGERVCLSVAVLRCWVVEPEATYRRGSAGRSASPVRSQWFIERSHQAMSTRKASSELCSSRNARPAGPSGVYV